MREQHTLILDEAGDVDPKTWEWFEQAMAEGRVTQRIVTTCEPLEESTAVRLIREFRTRPPQE